MDESRIQQQLDQVFKHIETYNREMGGVLSEIKNINSEMCGIKKTLNGFEQKLDKAINKLPTWATIGASVLTGLLGIMAGIAFK